MPNGTNDLLAKVREWLREQGQHLEFKVAERFARADFGIKQGVHVRSPEEKSREVDVFAFRAVHSERLVAGFAAVIECKYSKDKPWVVFSNPYGVLDDEDTVASLPGSPAWKRFAHELVKRDAALLDGPIIRRTTRHAFGGRQALGSKQADIVYEALQGVVGKVRDGLRDLQTPDEEGTTHVWAFLPAIVVDAPLIEAFWDESKQDVILEERTSIRLHWSGSHASDDDVAVDVIRASALDDYVGELRTAVDPFLELLHSVAHEAVTVDQPAPEAESAKSDARER